MTKDILYPEEVRCNYFNRVINSNWQEIRCNHFHGINQKKCVSAEKIIAMFQRIENMHHRATVIRVLALDILSDLNEHAKGLC